MRRRLAVFTATAALAVAVGVATAPVTALAGPPGFISIGWYGSLSACTAAAQANFPIHGPVYICEQHGTWYQLWMH